MKLARRIRRRETLTSAIAILALAGLGIRVGAKTASEEPPPPHESGQSALDPAHSAPFAGLRTPPPAVTDEPGLVSTAPAPSPGEPTLTNLNRSSEGLEVIQRPDGSGYVDLQGRFLTLSVVEVDENGNVETRCVSSPENATAAGCSDPSHSHSAPEE